MKEVLSTLLVVGLFAVGTSAQVDPLYRIFLDTSGNAGSNAAPHPGSGTLSYGNPVLPAGGGRLYIYGEFQLGDQTILSPNFDITIDGGVITEAWNYNGPWQDTLTGDRRWEAASPNPLKNPGGNTVSFTASNLTHMGLKNGVFADNFDIQHDPTRGDGDTLLGYIDVEAAGAASVWITVAYQGFAVLGGSPDSPISFGYGDPSVRAGDVGVRTLIAEATIVPTNPGPQHQTFLVTERNASTIWQWDPTNGSATVFHNEKSNDADYNPDQGLPHGWLAERSANYFASFDVGSGSGLNAQYILGQGGRTFYHYPKHIAVFDYSVVVMGRNSGTIWQYRVDGQQLTSRATGVSPGQGLATNGTLLYVSVWDGSASQFMQYDTGLISIGRVIPNPTGMRLNTNIFDFAYDAASGHWFGLATDSEQGTLTQTNQVIEFTMGGSVVAHYKLPFMADGFGLGRMIADSCYPDCDQSTGVGVLDVFDFLCFQNSFVNAEPYACDCDTSTGPGVCDVFDFLCFQNAFVGGCP